MNDYQVRLIDEKSELDTKIEKLKSFIESSHFEYLNKNEKRQLIKQLKIMIQYSNVLNERIICS